MGGVKLNYFYIHTLVCTVSCQLPVSRYDKTSTGHLHQVPHSRDGVVSSMSPCVWKYSFAYLVIDIWNSLSSDIVSACSISVFKHKLEFVDFTPFVHVEFA